MRQDSPIGVGSSSDTASLAPFGSLTRCSPRSRGHLPVKLGLGCACCGADTFSGGCRTIRTAPGSLPPHRARGSTRSWVASAVLGGYLPVFSQVSCTYRGAGLCSERWGTIRTEPVPRLSVSSYIPLRSPLHPHLDIQSTLISTVLVSLVQNEYSILIVRNCNIRTK